MRIDQAIGRKLLQTTSVTTICSDRIYHGLRLPDSVTYPAINYYELPEEVIETGIITKATVRISCRTTDAGTVQDLADVINYEMHNLQETIVAPTSSLSNVRIQNGNSRRQGLIFENDGEVYHVPVSVIFSVINTTGG